MRLPSIVSTPTSVAIIAQSIKQVPKKQYVRMGEGTAPDNLKQFKYDPIHIPSKKETGFETGLNLNVNLIA